MMPYQTVYGYCNPNTSQVIPTSIALCLLLIHPIQVWASDWKREQTYADTLQQTTAQSEWVWLEVENHPVFALWLAGEKRDQAQAAILLHDVGEHPDQRPLMHALRKTLPEHGWSSLAVQMPLREAGAEQEDYMALLNEGTQRINAAIAHVKRQGATKIALIGHGLGATMAINALSRTPDLASSLVALGLSWNSQTLSSNNIETTIKSLTLPFLDIYAEFDLPDVTASAHDRRQWIKDNPVYRQIMMDNENHTYSLDTDLVIKRIYSWLTTVANR